MIETPARLARQQLREQWEASHARLHFHLLMLEELKMQQARYLVITPMLSHALRAQDATGMRARHAHGAACARHVHVHVHVHVHGMCAAGASHARTYHEWYAHRAYTACTCSLHAGGARLLV